MILNMECLWTGQWCAWMENKGIVIAANNENGLNAVRVIKRELCIPIEALIVHPESKSRLRDEIVLESMLPRERVISWSKNALGNILSTLRDISSRWSLLSVNFGYIIPKQLLDLFAFSVNLHTGYLPWNRGSHPNVWPFIDGSPAGVALHLMTPELDAGPIIERSRIEIEECDTAKTLYKKLEEESIRVLKRSLLPFLEGEIHPFYPNEEGSFHSHKEFLELFEIDMDRRVSARDFIGLMKALSYPPYKNAYYVTAKGEKVFLDISVSKEEEN